MNDLRTAAQQALEALECHADVGIKADKAITALKATLAQQAEPVEPVAWAYMGIKQDGTEHGPHLVWKPEYMDAMSASKGAKAIPLYTAPPQRLPLTDEEILSVLRLAPPEPSLWPHLKDEAVVGDVQKAVLAIARAVERAHGIGEEK